MATHRSRKMRALASPEWRPQRNMRNSSLNNNYTPFGHRTSNNAVSSACSMTASWLSWTLKYERLPWLGFPAWQKSCYLSLEFVLGQLLRSVEPDCTVKFLRVPPRMPD